MSTLTIAERIRRPSPKMTKIACTIYGKGGVGKTTLLGTMPGQGLVLDVPQIEGGTMVLADQEDHVDVLSVDEWDQFQYAYDALNQGLVSPHTNVRYQWVAIDSLSAAQALAKRKALSERSIADAPKQVSQGDWGRIGQLMSELFYTFGKLNMHTIYTSQENLRESGDIHEYQPAISPMSLDALHPNQFLIGRLYLAEVPNEAGEIVEERRMRVRPSERYFTKVRSLRDRPFPAIIRNPDLRSIFGYALGADGYEQPEGVAVEAAFNPFAANKE